MNRKLLGEVPPCVGDWLEKHERVWHAVAREVALDVAATLLHNDGEAGVNRTVYKLLCQHRSPGVRWLTQHAEFTGRRWREKTVARGVSAFYAVSFESLYAELRWRRARERRAGVGQKPL